MAEIITLNAETRNQTGKGVARKLRAQGKLPAVVYGEKIETTSLIVDSEALGNVLKTGAGANVIFELKALDNKALDKKTVMVKDLQRDPLSYKIVHADLIEVMMDEKIQVKIPIIFIGKPKGVVEGGFFQEMHRSIEIECLPKDIPDKIEVNVAKLELNETLYLSDVDLPAEITPLAEGKYPLAQVLMARTEIEEEEGEGEEAAEGAKKAEEGEAKKESSEAEKKEK